MAKTGPQKITGASQAHFYGTGQYSGSDMEVNCGVVHTTEGRTLPDYSGGSIAPTVTGVPDIAAKKIRWYQHYDVDESASMTEAVAFDTVCAQSIENVPPLVVMSRPAPWLAWAAAVDGVENWVSTPNAIRVEVRASESATEVPARRPVTVYDPVAPDGTVTLMSMSAAGSPEIRR